MRALCKERIS